MAGLNSDQIGALRQMLQLQGWNAVAKPVIASRARAALEALTLDPSERSGQFEKVTDATLRARIQECEFLLSVFENEVNVFDANQRRALEQEQRNGVEDLVQTPPNA
jgi:hypothetical protein